MNTTERDKRPEEQSGLIRVEDSINPERVWGKKFKISSIIGEGSGFGFKIENLHLPRGWEKKIPEIETIGYNNFFNFFKQECETYGLKPGVMKYDSKGILRELSINTNPVSRLYLNLDFPREEDGAYESKNIKSALVGVVLHRTTAKFLNLLLDEEKEVHRGYPYIEGREHFGPMNLFIPKKFLDSKVSYSKEAFTIEASNILGRFGFSLGGIFFNEKNLLIGLRLREGNSCDFLLEKNGRFTEHNVDDAYQASALFGATAAYINHLLEY